MSLAMAGVDPARRDEFALADERVTFTWRALDPILNRAANALNGLDFTDDRRVAVFAPNSAETAIAYVACLEAGTGKGVWQTNTVTKLGNGSSIHLTPCGEAVFLFTDQGDIIRAQLTSHGYHEFSRAHLLEPTSPFGGKKCAWAPPAYANRHVFARNDKELVCASLAAKP